jgi:glucose/arabinose dehydrogenase
MKRVCIVSGLCLLAAALPSQRRGDEHFELTPARLAQRLTRKLELPDACGAAWCGLLEIGPPAVRPLVAAPADPREDVENPYGAQRLPNGNTLVADAGNQRVVEVSRAGKVVWEKTKLKRPVWVRRLPDGTVLIAEQNGDALEFGPDGELVRRITKLESPMCIERLSDGGLLVTAHRAGKLFEYGKDGAEPRVARDFVQAQTARRRRDGHTLIASTTQWIELDADGKQVWRRKGSYAVGVFW